MMLNLIDRLAGSWLDWRMDHLMKDSEFRSRFELKKLEADASGIFVIAIAPDLVYLADQCSALLEQNNAKNYVQFDMLPRLDRGLKPIRVTVQWADGESPAVKAKRLEQRLAKMKEQAEKFAAEFPDYYRDLTEGDHV